MSDKMIFTINIMPFADLDDRPPCVTVVDFPALPGESSRAYRRRVYPLVLAEGFSRNRTFCERALAWLAKVCR